MKKSLVLLFIFYLTATLPADSITFSSPEDGIIHYEATGYFAPVAMALDVDADGTITEVEVPDFFDIYMDAAHDMEMITPGSYMYGDGTPIADQDTVGELPLPQQNFCISMGGLGGETEPLEPAPMTGEIILTPGTATQATITENTLRGGVVGADGEPMEVTGFPLVVGLEFDCFDSGHPDYAEWVLAGKPDCWCYTYQCHGDADGAEEGNPKDGYYWVSYSDLNLLAANWRDRSGDTLLYHDYPADVCADFNRYGQPGGKTGYFRIYYGDLAILEENWHDTSTDTSVKGDDPYAHTCGGELAGTPTVPTAHLTWSQDTITIQSGGNATVQLVSDSDYYHYKIWLDGTEVAGYMDITALTDAGQEASVIEHTSGDWAGWWELKATADPYLNYPGTGNHFDVTLSGLPEGSYSVIADHYGVMNGPVTLNVNVVCFDPAHPDYTEWVAAGSPECWCYKFQCYGDADGQEEGALKKGYHWVAYFDLAVLTSAWKGNDPTDTPLSGDYPLGQECFFDECVNHICADFDRSEEGSPKKGYYRISYGDLDILTRHWKGTAGDTTALGDDPYEHTCGGEL